MTTTRASDTGWRPIDTAPRDGTRVDLWVIHPDRPGYRETDCRWETDDEGSEWFDRRGGMVEGFKILDQPYLIRATHWRPIPGPPAK